MLRRKQIVTMVSIAVMSFLVGTTVNFVATATDGNPFDKIWQAIYDLQDRVTSLEQSINGQPKTWHLVTSFTLSLEERVSPVFFVEGEKWRIKWEKQWAESFNDFIIWDENGHLIEWVQVGVHGNYPDANGIHYVPHGKGNYYIDYGLGPYGPNVDFTIESYH